MKVSGVQVSGEGLVLTIIAIVLSYMPGRHSVTLDLQLI